MINEEMVIVLDFGSRFNQLLTRKVRELGVYSELHSHKMTAEEIKAKQPKGIILAGGIEPLESKYDKSIFDLGIPIMTIGQATTLMIEAFAGNVTQADQLGYEQTSIRVNEQAALFQQIQGKNETLANNGIHIQGIPAGFSVDAETRDGQVVALSHQDKPIYGLLFHPETPETSIGTEVLKNFLFSVCQCAGDWTVEAFIDSEMKRIRDQVGNRKVLCALSGGVDSSVVAALIHKAIGDQLTCIFVDHGLLRKNEGNEVMKIFAEDLQVNIIKVDAQQRFLDKLKGVSDPEQKRKIIGNEFIYVFDDEAAKLQDIDFLAQGTLYSDVIESGTGDGKKVKSHHNVGGLPEDMQFELIEPLRTLFKDEVRAVGTALGLPDYLVWRQPFPGPGLAIRILGEVTEEKLTIVRESDAILREEIAKAGLDRDIWQYFTVLPNIRSVGMKNNERTYDHTIAIRAVQSVDGMTSEWARIPYDVLDKISKRIVREVDQVNRVVYDITSKPPATIEWE